jgi:glycerophosphoryl diester phosphodiesterase
LYIRAIEKITLMRELFLSVFNSVILRNYFRWLSTSYIKEQTGLFILILTICGASPHVNYRDNFNESTRAHGGLSFNLPERGLCAHRGAMDTHPENTIPAFLAAIEAGAHMIEFDVALTGDSMMVIIHDATVNRTTDGRGRVDEMTFAEIRKLDAGSWKSRQFAGELIPTLDEVLEIMPVNIWLNIHLKGNDILGSMVAEKIRDHDRLHQAFIACGAGAAEKARTAVPGIMICNMDRREKNIDYVNETIAGEAEFIQLRGTVYPEFVRYTELLRENGVKINYFGTDDPGLIGTLFDLGVDFPLVNDIVSSIKVAEKLGIKPVKPVKPVMPVMPV